MFHKKSHSISALTHLHSAGEDTNVLNGVKICSKQLFLCELNGLPAITLCKRHCYLDQ